MKRMLLTAGLSVLSGTLAYGRTSESLNATWSGTVFPEKGKSRTAEGIVLPHNWDDYYGHRHLVHGELHGTCVYRRSVTVKKDGPSRHFLVFDGAGTRLTVKVNGQELCKDRLAGRIVTTLEATSAVKDGENDLEVLCDHSSDYGDTPWLCCGCGVGTCESPEPFGLFRNVSLVTTGPVRIAPWGVHIWHDDLCKTGFVEVETDFGALAKDGLSVRIRQRELKVDQTLAADRVVRGTFSLAGAKLWSPKAPNLYDFTVEIVGKDGDVVDSENVRTGFNWIRWPLEKNADHRFIMNGEPVFVHGTAESDHLLGNSMAFDPEEEDARVAEYRKLGFNMFRDGHEPHSLRYLRRIEESGIMTYAGFSTRNYTETVSFCSNFLACVEQWVKERRNSPAVVMWGLQNESSLPMEFADKCRQLIRRLDPLSGTRGRPVVSCNGGAGTDWNVIQNWSGTYEGYGGRLATYERDLALPNQLLNGEYGAWRLSGWHSEPDEPFDIKGPWTEEHMARILYEKLMRAWKARDRVCGQILWTFFSHRNPGRSANIEDGYREIDKIGPVNMKGIYTLSGRRVEAWYLYYAYGQHLNKGDLGECVDKPLSWWLAEGHRLDEATPAPMLAPTPLANKTYVFRLNCGGDKTVDSIGNVWQADDTRYVRSWSQDEDLQVPGYRLDPVLGSQDRVEGGVRNAVAADQEIFSTYRYGRHRTVITLPAPTNADCVVEMYFAEPGSYGRAFDIAIDGKIVERKFRPNACAPDRNVFCRRYAVRTGDAPQIVITFPRVECNQAVLSAVAVATDEGVAGRMPPESRKPGYPESDGLTWKELSQRVRHKTPMHLLPPSNAKKLRKRAPQALPFQDKDGYHSCLVHPDTAGDYVARFKVVKGDPVGKTVYWKIEGEDWTGDKGDLTIKTGESVIAGPITEDGFVEVPLDTFINAGGFFFRYKIEGDSLSAREFVQRGR